MFNNQQDEMRDFSLLVNNQFLLNIVMAELPIIDYRSEVFTPNLLDNDTASHVIVRFTIADQREVSLSMVIAEVGEEFKCTTTLFLAPAIIAPIGSLENIDEFEEDLATPGTLQYSDEIPEQEVRTVNKTMVFRPTAKHGEVVVNETFIWLKEQIATAVSGVN